MTTVVPLRGWVPQPTSFGARLALVRQHEHWNVTEAARACGVEPESWRQWETGRLPRDIVGVCRAISARAGVDYLWLLDGFDPNGPRETLPRLDSNQEPAGDPNILIAHVIPFRARNRRRHVLMPTG